MRNRRAGIPPASGGPLGCPPVEALLFRLLHAYIRLPEPGSPCTGTRALCPYLRPKGTLLCFAEHQVPRPGRAARTKSCAGLSPPVALSSREARVPAPCNAPRSVRPVFLGAALVGWCQTMNMVAPAGIEPARDRLLGCAVGARVLRIARSGTVQFTARPRGPRHGSSQAKPGDASREIPLSARRQSPPAAISPALPDRLTLCSPAFVAHGSRPFAGRSAHGLKGRAKSSVFLHGA